VSFAAIILRVASQRVFVVVVVVYFVIDSVLVRSGRFTLRTHCTVWWVGSTAGLNTAVAKRIHAVCNQTQMA